MIAGPGRLPRLRPATNAPPVESNDSRGWFCGDDTAIGKFGRCPTAGELQRRVRHLRGDADVACGRSRVAGAARPRHLVGDGRRACHLRGAAVAASCGAPSVRLPRSGGQRAPAGRDQCPDAGRQRAVGSNRRRGIARSRSQVAARRRAAEPVEHRTARRPVGAGHYAAGAARYRSVRFQAAAGALAGDAGRRLGAGADCVQPHRALDRSGRAGGECRIHPGADQEARRRAERPGAGAAARRRRSQGQRRSGPGRHDRPVGRGAGDHGPRHAHAACVRHGQACSARVVLVAHGSGRRRIGRC